MSVMEYTSSRNNGVNGAGSSDAEGTTPGRCPMGEQRGPGRHHATARTGWTKEKNIAVMECYFLSNPVDENGKPSRGYRRRMHNIWNERQSFNITEQRLCDQARMIRKNEWLTALELEEIRKRMVNVNFEEGVSEEQDVDEAVVEGNSTEDDQPGSVLMNIQELTDEEREIIEEISSITEHNLDMELQGFKKVERTLLRKHVKEVNNVLGNIVTESISGTNNCTILIGRKLGLKPYRKRANGMKEPWWKRRIKVSIKEIRKHINILERKERGDLKRMEKYKELEQKYRIKRKGLFQQDQKRVYQQLGGKVNSNEKPDAIESKQFWSNIWDNKVDHKKDTEWLRELRAAKGDGKQDDIRITTEMVIQQTRKIPNWKCPGPDGVQGYWLKSFTALHERIADQLNGMIYNGVEIPKWMTTGKTVLCQKDPDKGNAADNYRPISCLPLMWKLMTGIISNVLYDFLEDADKLPNEQKGCRRRSRGTKDQLLIDKTVLNDCRKRHTNLGMAWIDYKKPMIWSPIPGFSKVWNWQMWRIMLLVSSRDL
ncbi:uncharacterized protein LOC134775604 [Penaeus indicus]|uniref:uncharacterized protein LOC134775604 n=1 Tax=Penaeus indicus TaxID=29960 RepID=UPI00300C222B